MVTEDKKEEIKDTPEDEAAETAGAEVQTEAQTEAETVEETVEAKEGKASRAERKEIKALKAENEKLAATAAEWEDKYKRMIAEYDNFRKRTAKEREGIYADAYSDLLKEILPVKDALEMAVTYNTEGESKVLEGVRMTLAKFTEALNKMGVTEIGEVGEEFNPELHNAVMHIEDENLGENVISQVMLKGYKKGDKVLRFAMVAVAN